MKRLFDFICSFLGLLVLIPILGFVAFKIISEDGRPVFYRGERIGMHGKPFRIFKFRTMVADAEKLGVSSTADDDRRITNIGRFLRKYKLDEVPQLINVLVGDMSLVGPRPEVKKFTDMYSDEEKVIMYGRELRIWLHFGIRMRESFCRGARIRIRTTSKRSGRRRFVCN